MRFTTIHLNSIAVPVPGTRQFDNEISELSAIEPDCSTEVVSTDGLRQSIFDKTKVCKGKAGRVIRGTGSFITGGDTTLYFDASQYASFSLFRMEGT